MTKNRALVLSVFVLVASIFPIHNVHAESFTITVPGHAWQMSFDFPTFGEYQGQTSGERFKFMGQSQDGKMWISFYGEPWSEGGTKECRATYWAKGSRNPMIKPESIQITDKERYSMVSYLIDGEFKGEHVKSANVSFYFVYKDSCVDVHVSKLPYAENDEKLVMSVGDSLKWE